MEKSCHQNQDRAKSWKNQFSNFLIEFWIEKSRHQNQDRAKSWKNQLFNTFLIETSKKNNFKVKLMPGHHQDAEYSPNRIYIYIYETVQLEPPPPSAFFSKINELCIKIQYTNICVQIVYIYMYLYIYTKPFS